MRSTLRNRLLAPTLLALLWACAGSAMAQWSVEIYTGSSATLPTTLELRQEGHPDTVITGVRYETRPWNHFESLALLTENYYMVRAGYLTPFSPLEDARLGVELEVLHDKVYYRSGDDPEGVVQHFELSDGVVYVLANASLVHPVAPDDAFPRGRVQVVGRLGAGPMITKPASTVRGEGLGHDIHGTWTGYELAGFGGQAAAQVRVFLTPWLTTGMETKFTYADVTQRIAGGTSRTTLPTVHLTFGLGVVH
jgi:hypothetical protein